MKVDSLLVHRPGLPGASESSHRLSSLPNILIALTLALGLAWAPVAWACKGTPSQPQCTRSIFLAKFCPRVVLVRSTAEAIKVPIGVLPFVTWTQNPQCGRPISAALRLTLTCTPVGGGPPTVIGPQTFGAPTIKVPTKPGPQIIGGPIMFMIPAGTLMGSLPQTCTVSGTYTVDFLGGSQASSNGVLSATGDTTVCLVDPAPGRPDVPRLDMQLITETFPRMAPGDTPVRFPICRRGDQAIYYFLITNNDPTESVTLDLESEGNQTSRLPNGFNPNDPGAAYNAGVHAISDPTPGTDVFGAKFADELAPGELIPEPAAGGPQRLVRNGITIPPLESTIVPIAMRSFGMCADGSCNERFVKVTGMFQGGDPALGCASTLLLVGNQSPKTPLLEITDTVKASPSSRVVWSPMSFFDVFAAPFDHTATHAIGNLPITQLNDPRLTKTAGARVPTTATLNMRFPRMLTDMARFDRAVGSASYNVQIFPAVDATPVVTNSVQVSGLAGGESFLLPAVLPAPLRQSFFDIFVDVSMDHLMVREGMQTLFNGMIGDFLRRPPQGLGYDSKICRTLKQRNQLDLPVVSLDPPGLTHVTDSPGRASFFDVFVNLKPGTIPRRAAKWTAMLSPARGTALGCGTHGMLDTPVIILDNLRNTAPNPSDNISILNVHVPGTINSPFRVPFQQRVLPDFCLQDATAAGLNLRFNSFTGDYLFTDSAGTDLPGRGRITIKGPIITLTHNQPDRRIHGTVDTTTMRGNATIQIGTSLPLTITDSDGSVACP